MRTGSNTEAHERAFRACVEALEDAPCTCYFTYFGGGEERVQCKRCAALVQAADTEQEGG